MKKMLIFCVLTVILSALFTGCTKEATAVEKLCRIEISDAVEHSNVAVLEQQRQLDISNFFDEDHWTEAAENNVDMIPKYVISLYQEKTPTVIKQENDEPYIKIMEYVTFENSDIVKVSISGGTVSNNSTKEYLSEYYVGSEKFFSALTEASQG